MDNIYLFKSLYKPTSVLDITYGQIWDQKKVLLKLQYTSRFLKGP